MTSSDNRKPLRSATNVEKSTNPRAELVSLIERISLLVAKNPQKAAIILTDWLKPTVAPTQTSAPTLPLKKKAG